MSCGYIYIANDNHVENNEDFTVVLGGWEATTAPYNNNTAYIRIVDDDGKLNPINSSIIIGFHYVMLTHLHDTGLKVEVSLYLSIFFSCIDRSTGWQSNFYHRSRQHT